MFRICRRMCRGTCRNIVNISKNEMLQIVRGNTNVVLLDVRSKQEYNEGHLNGSINIPVYDLYRCARNILSYESIIIVYCTAGTRSIQAIQILSRMGYKNLYNIKDGIDIYE